MSKRPVNVKMMIWKWYLPFTAILGTTTINHFWVAGIFPMSRVVVLNQSCWQDTTSTSNRASWGLFWLTASMSLRIENYRPSIIILIMVIDTVLNYCEWNATAYTVNCVIMISLLVNSSNCIKKLVFFSKKLILQFSIK